MDIVKMIGMPAMLGQAAEECCELGKALLKYQRILMGTNPTPVTPEQALADITEEAQDVRDCLRLLDNAGIATVDRYQSGEKMERWVKRMKSRIGKPADEMFADLGYKKWKISDDGECVFASERDVITCDEYGASKVNTFNGGNEVLLVEEIHAISKWFYELEGEEEQQPAASLDPDAYLMRECY